VLRAPLEILREPGARKPIEDLIVHLEAELRAIDARLAERKGRPDRGAQCRQGRLIGKEHERLSGFGVPEAYTP
jgi:hypothetical protein